MVEALFVLGAVVAWFVAYNIGGATTGPAFGPAVGAAVITKPTAAGLMSVCFFLGAWTYGRRVVTTLGSDLIHDPSLFTLEASVIILLFIGVALLVGNLTGVPASTSMTAVGSIAGFAFALDALNYAVLGEIFAWWILGPVIGFWIAVMIGRYLYPFLDRMLAVHHSGGQLIAINRHHGLPYPGLAPGTRPREAAGAGVVVGIGCLMAFSSGTSNIANAIAPLVGAGTMGMNTGIILGGAAVAIGAFTIARRTMETLGNDITDLPLTAAIIVAVVSSVIVIFLSRAGIPASFVVIATFCIVGLGWGRATRTVTVEEAVRADALHVTVGALGTDQAAPTVGDPGGRADQEVHPIGEEDAAAMPDSAALFDPSTTGRVVVMQNVVPLLATVAAVLTFTVLGPV